MNIDIITLFPKMFSGPFEESIVQRAQDKKLVQITIYDLRNWALDKRGTVDDKPYGGGTGMLLRPEPIFDVVKDIKSKSPTSHFVKGRTLNTRVVLLDAGGELYNQKKAAEYSKLDQLILICGHYEGVDYRVHEHLADEIISIGNFVLTGGEIPAMLIADSVTRLIPGVLEKEEATTIESFSDEMTLEYPQYTRPEIYQGHKVPEILLSGDHAKIDNWRKEESIKRTEVNRSDLA
ncbi:tRNA (guanosine(37)-N1)-methyltransferase TrmD [Candidatus Roizmanbacteria bacterium CG22_combo_CG10-13_8_21_14_all_38_20]|uniref:tRNA (guanine-N(1)-)-methyltransferase n=1 Tax=Candidatus Roizmanbacteria bacterium CG22_combo_CG10-13_8_21_14_all_38_20 TaxID=1974862 RepID=A0A2H0BUJ4_9BACT|nr:tRNA (guanosine(37)-N1)-methyltransferase TrmD [Candidatus Microgenomates bacterium]PIP61189.1 MAG: tRNA (guanosine(37)-N1)-methyltransferase TrmD [Candidatus Roizmanbacteria bacterium CG22_combo_CG10-13_8_21_14_all_38_20]PJC31179.1 MAG: tRNA (guanosine(37)-N1)-methyltransferase TrmD [Candidatus Roizmanbacteria bacterium CG_4_9_14_0_2_um_filter_38_17]